MKRIAFLLAVSIFVVTLDAAEPSGGGILFDGETGYRVEAKELKLEPKQLSVSVWVRVDPTCFVLDSTPMFVSLGETNMDGFKLYLNNRKPSAVRMQYEYDPQPNAGVGKTYTMAKAPIPEAGKWVHYLGTYDGQTIKVYMNGEKKGEQAAACKRETLNAPALTFGATAKQEHFLKGTLDDIRLWNRTLDADEAARVADGKNVDNGLIGRWTADKFEKGKLTNAVEDGPNAVPFKKGSKIPMTAASVPITVDGKPLEFFEPNKTDYCFFLPGGTDAIPVVEAVGADVAAPDADRYVAVTLKNPAGEKKTYRIAFKTLPPLDLFLCIGQSNMAGRGPMDEAQGDMKPLDNVYLFTPEGNWVPANNPLNRYSSVRKELGMQQISPAYGFAKKLSAKTKRPIGLVVNAKGGTRIESWLKGSNDRFFDEAVRRAKEARRWGTFKGILWHQGEGNSGQPAAYPAPLKKMVGDLRTELGDTRLFFVAGEIAHWSKNDAGEPFNKMIRGIASFLDHSAWVSAADLTPLRGDVADPHFDRPSQLILGERYADAVLEGVYAH